MRERAGEREGERDRETERQRETEREYGTKNMGIDKPQTTQVLIHFKIPHIPFI